MELVLERAENHIQVVLQKDLSSKERVITVLLECVPSDGILELIQQVINCLYMMNLLKTALNTDLEVEQLYALIGV